MDSWTARPAAAIPPQPKKKRSRKVRVMVAVASFALAIAGGALAAWLTGGTGNGRAQAGSLTALTVNPDDVNVNGYLYPGGDGDVSFTVSNPNGQQLSIVSVVQSGTITLEGGGSAAACAITVNAGAFDDLVGTTLAANNGNNGTLASQDAVHMGAGADTSCQNAVFAVPLTVNATT